MFLLALSAIYFVLRFVRPMFDRNARVAPATGT